MADAWWMPPGGSYGTSTGTSMPDWGGSLAGGTTGSTDSWGTLGGLQPAQQSWGGFGPWADMASPQPTTSSWGGTVSNLRPPDAAPGWAPPTPPATPATPAAAAPLQPWDMPPSSGVKMVNGSLTPMSSADLTQYGMFGLRP
jgi:hypothetical protein